MWYCIYRTRQVALYGITFLAFHMPSVAHSSSINLSACAQSVSHNVFTRNSAVWAFLSLGSSKAEKKPASGTLYIRMQEKSHAESSHLGFSLIVNTPFGGCAALHWGGMHRTPHYTYEQPVLTSHYVGICSDRLKVGLYWRYAVSNQLSQVIQTVNGQNHSRVALQNQPCTGIGPSGHPLAEEAVTSHAYLMTLQPASQVRDYVQHQRHRSMPALRSDSIQTAGTDWLSNATWEMLLEMSTPLRHRRKLHLTDQRTPYLASNELFSSSRILPMGRQGHA